LEHANSVGLYPESRSTEMLVKQQSNSERRDELLIDQAICADPASLAIFSRTPARLTFLKSVTKSTPRNTSAMS